MSNVYYLPISRGDKAKAKMVSALRNYADMIELGHAEPQIDMFVLALKHGDQFIVGGSGLLYRKERELLKKSIAEFIKGLDNDSKSENQ